MLVPIPKLTYREFLKEAGLGRKTVAWSPPPFRVWVIDSTVA
jgi:hypothetical protein